VGSVVNLLKGHSVPLTLSVLAVVLVVVIIVAEVRLLRADGEPDAGRSSPKASAGGAVARDAALSAARARRDARRRRAVRGAAQGAGEPSRAFPALCRCDRDGRLVVGLVRLRPGAVARLREVGQP
jgi:hypothetical protein